MWRINQNQDSWFHTRKTSLESKNVFHATQDWWFSQRLLYQTNRKISLPPQLLQNTWKNHVAGVRYKAFESTPDNISNWLDYAEKFSFVPNSKLQNEIFDRNCTLSMEVWCLDRFRKKVSIRNFYDNGGGYVHQTNDMVWEFHLNLSDSKLKNDATTTDHLYTLLDRMFEKKQMIRGGTMWYQTYGCTKQYSCSIACYLMSFLSKLYQIVLDRSVDTSGHGKYVVDGFNDIRKQKFANCSRMSSTPELDKIFNLTVRVNLTKR